MGSRYCFSCRQLRLITMLLKFERQFSGRLRIAGTNYRPSRAALMGVWGQQAEGQAAVPGACSPNLSAVLVEANAWLFQGTVCFFIERHVSMSIHMYVYVWYVDMCVYICWNVSVYKCENIYLYWVYIHVYMCVLGYICACMLQCVYVYVRMCVCVYVYICLYISSRILITFQSDWISLITLKPIQVLWKNIWALVSKSDILFFPWTNINIYETIFWGLVSSPSMLLLTGLNSSWRRWEAWGLGWGKASWTGST